MKPDAFFAKFAPMAIDQAHRYKIPPAVTLAQAAMESGWGESTLAREGNNYFGIKCGPDWSGQSMYRDDDKANECFRVYNSPSESFEDHSKFLKRYSRYAFLFALPFGNYVAWFHGLKKAGYGTDPGMAAKLISIVGKYGLDKYNRLAKFGSVTTWVIIGVLVLLLFAFILILLRFKRKRVLS